MWLKLVCTFRASLSSITAHSFRGLAMRRTYRPDRDGWPPKKGIPGTLGRRAWKNLFWLISRVLGLLGHSCPPWAPFINKLDEDLFLHVFVRRD